MIKRAGRAVGFTLVEMAIVLVVIGLITSGGLLALSPVLQSSKISDTNGRLDRIEQALTLYVIRNSCLPCPASPTARSTVAGDNAGQSDAGGVYTSGCRAAACTNALGVVPWVNLGISENEASDGFDTRISYAITDTLQNADGMKRNGGAYPAGTLAVNNASAPITTAAAYVLISHGPDRSFGYRAQTGAQATTTDPNGSTLQDNNDTGAPTYIQDNVNTLIGANYFDDIVRWRSARMIVQLCGASACGNP